MIWMVFITAWQSSASFCWVSLQSCLAERMQPFLLVSGCLAGAFTGACVQFVILDKIPDTLKADGYPDVQVFMRTFREMESVVEQYNRDLAQWEYQVSRKPTAAAKEQCRPLEKQSVLKHLREIQERNKQEPPQRQRKKSIDRDSR